VRWRRRKTDTVLRRTVFVRATALRRIQMSFRETAAVLRLTRRGGLGRGRNAVGRVRGAVKYAGDRSSSASRSEPPVIQNAREEPRQHHLVVGLGHARLRHARPRAAARRNTPRWLRIHDSRMRETSPGARELFGGTDRMDYGVISSRRLPRRSTATGTRGDEHLIVGRAITGRRHRLTLALRSTP